MNLELNQTTESIYRKNEVNWKLRWRRFLTSIKILFFCTMLLIILSLQQLIFFNQEFEKSSRFNQNSIYILLIISILLLFFIGTQYFKYRSQKKIYFKNINSLKSSLISINDEFLTFKNEMTESTVKWNAIKTFYYLDNCLFLSKFKIKDTYEYIIDLQPFEKTVKNQLLEFVMKNVQKK